VTEDHWIECDAFTSNDFKVGDIVRIYDDVLRVGDYEVQEVWDDRVKSRRGPLQFWSHFKACRLLKKRALREWMLTGQSHDGPFVVIPVRVREVLDGYKK